MASTSAIFFTLPRFTTISTNPSPKSFPLNLKRSRVSVTAKVNDDDSPSQLIQLHGNNDVIGEDETVVSYNKLPRILKPLASIMLSKSEDGDQIKRVEERRLELVNEYLSFNKGLVFQYIELARVLKDWYFSVKEQEEDSDAAEEVGMWKLVKIGSLVKKIVSWFHGVHFLNLEFENLMLLCSAGVALAIVGVFMLTSILILMLLTPPPPPSPPPSPPPFIPNFVDKFWPFFDLDPISVVKDWMTIGVNVLKDVLPFDKVRLVMLATQMKILIPVMMMVAAVR